jgi:hypothetical protein
MNFFRKLFHYDLNDIKVLMQCLYATKDAGRVKYLLYVRVTIAYLQGINQWNMLLYGISGKSIKPEFGFIPFFFGFRSAFRIT